MATVRDSDISLWLHNKLGTSNDSWTSGSICSQLNPEVLKNIKDCFPDLQTQVKLKLLLSFFHIPRRNMDEWKSELEEILEVATVDTEQWVSMVAELMKTYPATMSLNTEIGEVVENKRIFSDLINDLRKLVKRQSSESSSYNSGSSSNSQMLPLECQYLNKSALISVVGQQSSVVKHFTLKRKPKSAALRAELVQKSMDAASNLKKSATPTVPVRSRGMPRKMTDTTPLKGIPSRVPSGGFRSPQATLSSSLSRPMLSMIPRTSTAGRKDGGIKLLDIAEQPLGYAQAKKKKKQELEEAKRASELSASLSASSLVPSSSSSPPPPLLPPATPSSQSTPDYAAGLTSLNPPTPSPAPPATPAGAGMGPQPPTPSSPSPSPQQSLVESNVTAIINNVATDVNSIPSLAPISHVTKVHQQQHNVIVINQQQAGSQQMMSQQQTVLHAQPTPPPPPTSVRSATPQQITIAAPINSNPAALELTREQMLQAQEMFKNANIVSRTEKALILGFMAGVRENPCPTYGNVVTIKLSESQESHHVEGPMMVETHFQMNYNTGEWKRIKKYKTLPTVS
uniref:Negative elongation factor A n=2 Tax=Cacopsylla melanoneura TaxID=428564 RepID=A0A8D8QBK1_9HEMI